ncbi:uncharacterized protein LOC119674753 [Teleopsis dalmanni]|uniref:uncharacterized protein LOC119674753 n=1 Tax=Teleopsis dalmanni TaxID=139649 RepID=UPI0018CFD700|nr:uncharacterized protein LOC119674753 [Teleopsis dalmanni]
MKSKFIEDDSRKCGIQNNLKGIQNKRLYGNDKNRQITNKKIVLSRKRRGCILNLSKAHKSLILPNISISDSVNPSADSDNLSNKTTKKHKEQLAKPKAENINTNRYNLRLRKNLISTNNKNGYSGTRKNLSKRNTVGISSSLSSKEQFPTNSSSNGNANKLMTAKSKRNKRCQEQSEVVVPHTKRNRNFKRSSKTRRNEEEAPSTSRAAYRGRSKFIEYSSEYNGNTQISSMWRNFLYRLKNCFFSVVLNLTVFIKKSYSL